jgi:hypothetical protein
VCSHDVDNWGREVVLALRAAEYKGIQNDYFTRKILFSEFQILNYDAK